MHDNSFSAFFQGACGDVTH